MQQHSFLRQSKDKPLFPDLLWSRPENRLIAGKLLIIGGNLHGFAAPAAAYKESVKSGIGTARVLLPDALKRTVGNLLENGEFAPSTPSGSFGKQALAEMLEHAAWADGVLVAGDLGRNSETAALLETFLQKFSGQVTITKDAVDFFYANPLELFSRTETTIVCSIAQLQKLCKEARTPQAFTFSMGVVQLSEALIQLMAAYPANIVLQHLNHKIVASSGKVSLTAVTEQEAWRVKTAAHTSVWWLQNPSKPFEALTTGVLQP